MARRKKSQIVVSYRHKENTEVVGVYPTHEKAMEAAIDHLKSLNVDECDLDGLTWEEAVEQWEDLSDGYEDFTFVER